MPEQRHRDRAGAPLSASRRQHRR